LTGLLLVGVSEAAAGEAAARRVIGFSPDGRHFAVEEFGHSDPGMGTIDLHSFITVVDTATNTIDVDSVETSVKGGEEKLIGLVCALTARAAAATLRADKIVAAGRRIGADASSRAGEQFYYLNVWPVEKAARASLDIEAPEIGGKAELVLDYAAPTPVAGESSDAEPSSDKPPTFALALVKPDGKRMALTRDVADPWATSRGAFYKYAIAEAYLMPRPGKAPVIAAHVETFTAGAEGANRNFIPVAIELPAP
jgi:hypothetical protein